jgi:hypothetical protein
MPTRFSVTTGAQNALSWLFRKSKKTPSRVVTDRRRIL